jgi:transposase-like protein
LVQNALKGGVWTRLRIKAEAPAEKREKPISRIAGDLDVNESVLLRWMRQARQAARGGLPPFPGHGRSRDEELARRRKEAKALREAV